MKLHQRHAVISTCSVHGTTRQRLLDAHSYQTQRGAKTHPGAAALTGPTSGLVSLPSGWPAMALPFVAFVVHFDGSHTNVCLHRRARRQDFAPGRTLCLRLT